MGREGGYDGWRGGSHIVFKDCAVTLGGDCGDCRRGGDAIARCRLHRFAAGLCAPHPILTRQFHPAHSSPMSIPSFGARPLLFIRAFFFKKVKSFFGEADNALKSGVLHIHVGCHVTQQTARSETNIHPFR